MDTTAQVRPCQFPDSHTPRIESFGKRSLRALRNLWPFVMLAVVQAIVAISSLQILDAMRALSTAENHWSGAQKDAIYSLNRYARTGDIDAYQQFRSALNVGISDMQARQLLEQPAHQARTQAARLLLQQGGNALPDIDSMIWMIKLLEHNTLMQKLVANWRDSDIPLLALQKLGSDIHNRYASHAIDTNLHESPINAAQQHSWLTQAHALGTQLARYEQDFSDTLQAVARQINTWLWWLNMSGVLAMLVLLVWHTRRLQRHADQAEDALGVVSERAYTTLAAIGDAVVTTNTAGAVLYMNRAAEKMLGTSLEQMFMLPLMQCVQPAATEENTALLQNAIADALQGKPLPEDTVFSIHDGQQQHMQVTMAFTPIDQHQGTSEAVFVFHDVSQVQNYMHVLAWQAAHDQLTGLLNRFEFERRLELLLSQKTAADGCRGAVMYLDLDQFKVINDTCGHLAGDAMLRAIATMLGHGLRADDTLARVGGDEFAVLLEYCPFDIAQEIAEQIIDAALRLRIDWAGRSLSSGISIGLIKLSGQLDSVQEIFRVADMACYGAKERGRNTVYAYDPDVDCEIARYAGEMEWIDRIKIALQKNWFILYAQPIAALHAKSQTPSDSGMHIEVQLRMRMPDGSIISPGHFIPAAERYGLMPMVDRWVVKKTLETLAQLKQTGTSPAIALCAINLSGTTLGDEKLLDFLRHHIELHGIAPNTLCFEITETAAITHLPNAIRLIKALKSIGCKFSLDDFGAGVSSFASLKNLPVDFLKIDGAIVADMLHEPAHRAMVEAINHLGHALGMQTIAEFATTAEVLEMLRQMGIDHAQGYASGMPAPFSAGPLPTEKPAQQLPFLH